MSVIGIDTSNYTTSIAYFNGKDGVDGKDGKNGIDGKDGVNGYTPEKGVDYFTEDDITDIANRALQLLPDNREVAY